MRTLLVITFVIVFAAAADAQVTGYGVAGPAGAIGFVNTRSITFHAAGGAEVYLGKFFTLGGEAGMFDRLITTSANAAIHASGEEGIVPFLTAGYTRLGVRDGEGGANAWNIGAGGDAWLSKHAGIRFELRDHIRLDHRGNTHYWSARVGVAIR